MIKTRFHRYCQLMMTSIAVAVVSAVVAGGLLTQGNQRLMRRISYEKPGFSAFGSSQQFLYHPYDNYELGFVADPLGYETRNSFSLDKHGGRLSTTVNKEIKHSIEQRKNLKESSGSHSVDYRFRPPPADDEDFVNGEEADIQGRRGRRRGGGRQEDRIYGNIGNLPIYPDDMQSLTTSYTNEAAPRQFYNKKAVVTSSQNDETADAPVIHPPFSFYDSAGRFIYVAAPPGTSQRTSGGPSMQLRDQHRAALAARERSSVQYEYPIYYPPSGHSYHNAPTIAPPAVLNRLMTVERKTTGDVREAFAPTNVYVGDYAQLGMPRHLRAAEAEDDMTAIGPVSHVVRPLYYRTTVPDQEGNRAVLNVVDVKQLEPIDVDELGDEGENRAAGRARPAVAESRKDSSYVPTMYNSVKKRANVEDDRVTVKLIRLKQDRYKDEGSRAAEDQDDVGRSDTVTDEKSDSIPSKYSADSFDTKKKQRSNKDPCFGLTDGDYAIDKAFIETFPTVDPECNFVKCSNNNAYVYPCAIGARNMENGQGSEEYGFCGFRDDEQRCGFYEKRIHNDFVPQLTDQN